LEHSGETTGGICSTRASAFARVRVGRLVELRVHRLRTLAEVESLHAAVIAAIRIAGPGAVSCADHRYASPVLSPEVADAWSRGMRVHNPVVSRGAILLHPANTTFNLQIERIVQCAGHGQRRVFTDQEELQSWLGAELTEAERIRLGVFLSDNTE
jgi:hypothetical protein